MKFNELDDFIPSRFFGGVHNVTIPLTEHVKVCGPGKYGPADFLMLLDAPTQGWFDHRVTWGQLFVLFDSLTQASQREKIDTLVGALKTGLDLDDTDWFVQTVAVLSYCEGRRFAHKNSVGGGQFLPTNVLVEIYSDRCSGSYAARNMRRGIGLLQGKPYVRS